MSKKDQEIFDEYMAEMDLIHKAINDHNEIILDDLQKELGEKYIKDIKDCLEDCEVNGKLTIVDNPGIEPQTDDWGSFDHILVDQYIDGGMDGDDFAGYVYIPIGGKYLKSHYAM